VHSVVPQSVSGKARGVERGRATRPTSNAERRALRRDPAGAGPLRRSSGVATRAGSPASVAHGALPERRRGPAERTTYSLTSPYQQAGLTVPSERAAVIAPVEVIVKLAQSVSVDCSPVDTTVAVNEKFVVAAVTATE